MLRLQQPMDPADLAAARLAAEPTPLQQLVISLSTRVPVTPARAGTHDSTDYEGATR